MSQINVLVCHRQLTMLPFGTDSVFTFWNGMTHQTQLQILRSSIDPESTRCPNINEPSHRRLSFNETRSPKAALPNWQFAAISIAIDRSHRIPESTGTIDSSALFKEVRTRADDAGGRCNSYGVPAV